MEDIEKIKILRESMEVLNEEVGYVIPLISAYLHKAPVDKSPYTRLMIMKQVVEDGIKKCEKSGIDEDVKNGTDLLLAIYRKSTDSVLRHHGVDRNEET